ncbi:MAG TPA: hypothetical protein VFX78_10370 [Candidatus Eisenbacteria bacterium]|nr:hypothetical protein [Candidatus Eisenbacteria bacterium]
MRRMGNVYPGIPQSIVLELARIQGATILVETGTFLGATAQWAAAHFDRVHTIERSEQLYQQAHVGLAHLTNVTQHLGSSREILPRIVQDFGAERAVYWLDAHWSGGATAGEDDECPVLGELASLSIRTEDIILIDDARLFLCAPPPPHDPAAWPTIADILQAAPKSSFVQIVDDVIFIVPAGNAPLKKRLIEHAQERSTVSGAGGSPLKTRVKELLKRAGVR